MTDQGRSLLKRSHAEIVEAMLAYEACNSVAERKETFKTLGFKGRDILSQWLPYLDVALPGIWGFWALRLVESLSLRAHFDCNSGIYGPEMGPGPRGRGPGPRQWVMG